MPVINRMLVIIHNNSKHRARIASIQVYAVAHGYDTYSIQSGLEYVLAYNLNLQDESISLLYLALIKWVPAFVTVLC